MRCQFLLAVDSQYIYNLYYFHFNNFARAIEVDIVKNRVLYLIQKTEMLNVLVQGYLQT